MGVARGATRRRDMSLCVAWMVQLGEKRNARRWTIASDNFQRTEPGAFANVQSPAAVTSTLSCSGLAAGWRRTDIFSVSPESTRPVRRTRRVAVDPGGMSTYVL